MTGDQFLFLGLCAMTANGLFFSAVQLVGWWKYRHVAGWRWCWANAVFAAGFGPLIWTAATADRPAWMPAPPGGVWVVQFFLYVTAGFLAFGLSELWRVSRARFAVRELGEPRLVAVPDASLSLALLAGVPPALAPPAEVEPQFGRAGFCGVAVLFGLALWVAATGGPPFRPAPAGWRALYGGMGAAGCSLLLAQALAAVWGVPTGRRGWVTDRGLATWRRTVTWENADAISLAPAPPGPPPGTGSLTVTAGGGATRLLVAPGSVGTLAELLHAAVPPPAGGLSIPLPSPRTLP